VDATAGLIAVDDVIAVAEHEWRALGLDRRDSAALAADLRQDLEAAAADGVTARALLGDDVRGFARRLAEEAGARRVPYEQRRLLLTALAGAVPGMVLGYLLLYAPPVVVPADVPVLVAVLAYYVPPCLAVLGGALLAVWWRMREVPGIAATVAAMAVLTTLAAAVVTPVTMGFAWLTGYSTAAPVMLVEVGLVVAALAGATVLARRWALRARATR
jgi:hypothetical protein